jgi:hypothetical protein
LLWLVTAWGSAFVAIRAAGEALSPGAIALGRLLVSSAVLGAVALVRREGLPPPPARCAWPGCISPAVRRARAGAPISRISGDDLNAQPLKVPVSVW